MQDKRFGAFAFAGVGLATAGLGAIPPYLIQAAAQHEKMVMTLEHIYPQLRGLVAKWSIERGQTTVYSTLDWLDVPWSIINEADPYRAEHAFWRLCDMITPMTESLARLMVHAQRPGSLGTIVGRWFVDDVLAYSDAAA